MITVAGTNGKGSSVALLDRFLRSTGVATGTYTSPHLIRFNERICLDSQPVADEVIVDALRRIEAVREDEPLTYFEFTTLAALVVFSDLRVDAAILEVGLGGRLDAVNAIDADAMLITSIGLDHQHWLGTDIESIGAEKAGILRPGRPAVFAGDPMPASVRAVAIGKGTYCAQANVDFSISTASLGLTYRGFGREIRGIHAPIVAGAKHQQANAAGVITVLALLGLTIDLTADRLNQAWANLTLPGRLTHIPGQPSWVIDVAHNMAAVAALADFLATNPVAGRTHIICGMLADKAPATALRALVPSAYEWALVSTHGSRGLSAASLAAALASQGATQISEFDSVSAAIAQVSDRAAPDDRIVVTGSFHIVGPALAGLELY